MTGPEHYRRGGELLAKAEVIPSDHDETNPAAALLTAQAHAHFAAAQAAATALEAIDRVWTGEYVDSWVKVTSEPGEDRQ